LFAEKFGVGLGQATHPSKAAGSVGQMPAQEK
jgi:hypothetical protein